MEIIVESAILEEATVSTSLPFLNRDRKIRVLNRPKIPISMIRNKSGVLVFSVVDLSTLCFLIQSGVCFSVYMVVLVACINNILLPTAENEIWNELAIRFI